MIVLSARDVSKLLPMTDAIKVVQEAMIGVARGEASLPLRHAIDVGGVNKLGIMPGVLSDGGVYGVKLLSLFPGNPANGLSSHIGAMVLFSPDTGEVSAMISADALTAIRTAAASAAATRVLAREDASVLAIVGTGEQAESHVQAISAVRDIREVRVAGRDYLKARAFTDRMSDHYDSIVFKPAQNVQAAVKDADIVCTVTSSAKPVLFANWLARGTHVNAVGASMPIHQEIDQSVILASEIFVDYRPSAFAQAREIIDALASGVLRETDILAEIGAVYSGDHQGRSDEDAITLYRSLGVASQDLACAEFVRLKAIENGIGVLASVS
jgi:ornithine cyclodeaminase/alanine dehydrogenase-like protein (mu-crystallin family)